MTETEKVAKYGHIVCTVASRTSDSKYEIRTKDGIEFSCQCPAWRFSKQTPRTCKHIQAAEEAAGEIIAEDPVLVAVSRAFQKHIPGCRPDRRLIDLICQEVRPMLGAMPIAAPSTKTKPSRLIYMED